MPARASGGPSASPPWRSPAGSSRRRSIPPPWSPRPPARPACRVPTGCPCAASSAAYPLLCGNTRGSSRRGRLRSVYSGPRASAATRASVGT